VRLFAAAPTRAQAKRIFWNDLKSLVPKEWKQETRDSDLFIRTWWGAELWVLGLDAPERMEGTPWDGGIVDEIANCKPGTWEHHIRPALADRRGWAWLIGVPDYDSPGQTEYASLHDMARQGQDPEWAVYHWPSWDILAEEEVESARRRMDPALFEQEFGGRFVKPGGLAFPTFDYALHVRDDIARYDPALPICWSLDFNVNPMCSGVIQHHRGHIRVIDELTLADSSTPAAVARFLSLSRANGWSLTNMSVYGDASGSARTSTTGRSDWVLVRQGLEAAGVQAVWKVPRANPPIKDTLNAVRAKLQNAAGEVGIAINSRCRRLIQDFRDLLWPSDLSSGHAMAWLRYFVAREYPVQTQTAVCGVYGTT